MFEYDKISYRYDAAQAVLENLDFTLPSEGIYGLFGTNGIGKTTLLKLLGGVLKTDNMSVRQSIAEYRITYLDADFLTLDQLTGREFLEMIAGVNAGDGARFIPEEYSDIITGRILKSKIRHMSLGQCQRVLLTAALLTPCDLLLLDEPFNGLDVGAKQAFQQRFRRKAAQCCLLYATHHLEDAESFTDSCLILNSSSQLTPVEGKNMRRAAEFLDLTGKS